MDGLPTNYDAIVLGTGMTESIIAAALSRVGKSVLHLDINEHYGGDWASFNLENLEIWIENLKNNSINSLDNQFKNDFNISDEIIVPVKIKQNIDNIVHNKYITKVNELNVKEEKENENIEDKVHETSFDGSQNKSIISLLALKDKMIKQSKRFNLDLCPKLLFSKGPMVDLLISSNIAKYAEFKSASRVLTWRNSQLETVPCSRADVFATKNVSVVQKRILVKMLTLFANYTENLDEFQGFEDKTFLDFLKHKKLPDNLIHYILYAIAMGNDRTLCLAGVKACKAFLESLGRYGNAPFIFPLYGSGELPQCFCRLCAVFGGTYCLKRGIEGLIVKNNMCIAVISNGVRLNAKMVIMSSSCTIDTSPSEKITNSISRGVLITDRSILQSNKETLTLLQFPPVPQVSEEPVTIIELGSETCTCPQNFFVVHLITKASQDADSDLKHVITSLFDTENLINEQNYKPKILWSLIWNTTHREPFTNHTDIKNVKICSSVDSNLDYDASINEAKQIFSELCSGEEFLPRAPDPDEIILDVEDNKCDMSEPTEKVCKEELSKSEEFEKSVEETIAGNF